MDPHSKPKPKRTRGAPPGNQNNRKHGFYSRLFPASYLSELEKISLPDLTEEISLMRLLIRRLVDQAPDVADLSQTLNLVRTVCLASANLNRLVKTQHLLAASVSKIDEAFEKALQELAEEGFIPRDP